MTFTCAPCASGRFDPPLRDKGRHASLQDAKRPVRLCLVTCTMNTPCPAERSSFEGSVKDGFRSVPRLNGSRALEPCRPHRCVSRKRKTAKPSTRSQSGERLPLRLQGRPSLKGAVVQTPARIRFQAVDAYRSRSRIANQRMRYLFVVK